MTDSSFVPAAAVRQTFIDYFVKNGHRHVPSAPLAAHNDPTLLFNGAGMAPFKNVFTGQETRDYDKAVTAQKCLRAGGKHNDLDNVGYTCRHHTFFEMLGNFGFGSYFKEQAIFYAWDLVVREYGLPADRLWITVYHQDDEAFDLWRRIAGVAEERILRIASSDNFWAMGDVGPCGPCSEIFYDHGDAIPGGPPGSPDEDGDRFVEIWNLVFMQYERLDAERRVDLPKPSIDTGMGLERIAAVLQGTHDNYDTDLFRPLIAASIAAAGGEEDDSGKPGHRVIADHMRATAFLIADGVLPSNEGRGHVLRRIMRRAMRHGAKLGVEEPFMAGLTPTLIATMGPAFPELARAEALMTATIRHEEERFLDLLKRGLHLLDEETKRLPSGGRLSGETAFRLYDTYGFSLDLTEDALRESGMSVDRAGFEAAMAAQRREARRAWKGSGDAAVGDLWFSLLERDGAADFIGYSATEAEGEARALIIAGGEVELLAEGDEGELIASPTPFYGEAGGQLGDHGEIRNRDGAVFEVVDTIKPLNGLIVHRGRMKAGELKRGDRLRLSVDDDRRASLRRSHSATHLLHAALRRVLGDHVTQKGSLAAPDRLRFDFSHPQAMTAAEIEAVEEAINRHVVLNDPVSVSWMPLERALSSGAAALFGEKYDDEVRVLAMGRGEGDDAHFSVELCGGTHVERTGDIGLVTIVGESGVAAGVRRIEALTAAAARRNLRSRADAVRSLAERLRVPPERLEEQIVSLQDERRDLTRRVAELRKKLAFAAASPDRGDDDVRSIGDVKLLARRADVDDAAALRGLIDDGKRLLGSGVVALAAGRPGGKAMLAVGVTADLLERHDAIALARCGAERLGGKGGGGRSDLALAGGPDGAGVEAALAAIAEAVAAAEKADLATA